MKDIMTIVKSLQDSGVLIKSAKVVIQAGDGVIRAGNGMKTKKDFRCQLIV